MRDADVNSSTQDSLFDDDVGILGGICFDLDVQQVVPHDGAGRARHASSWCKSSSASSCCSLCRLPAVSEAGEEDESNVVNLGLFNDASLVSMPGVFGTQAQTSNDPQVSLSRASYDKISPRRRSACDCCSELITQGDCDQRRDLFQVPIKSISIPTSCMQPGSTKEEPKGVILPSICGIDYLSASFLSDDALCHIIKFLDVSSLMNLRKCNKKLREASSKNSAGWADHCKSLWSSKANVCSAAREMLAKSSKAHEEGTPNLAYSAMEAYKMSVTDAAKRKEISLEELCFDSSPEKKGGGAVWSFRFKESAGRDWTSWDPWWNQELARKLVFLRDGTVKQVHPQGLESGARSHDGTTLYDVFSERTIRVEGGAEEVPAPRIEMKWRFVNRPLDLPVRPEGAYVRITVGGRDVPTYVVRRSPNGNWGFVLESCWGVYASFELAPQAPLTNNSGAGRRRLRRTRNGSRWVQVEDDSDGDVSVRGDDGEERERMRNVRRRIDLFVEESAMTQDGYSQWREALLYNIGAVTLPEGNGDQAVEFDNAWQNAMMMR